MSEEQKPKKPSFELFGLTWQPRDHISYAEWRDFVEKRQDLDLLAGFFVDPEWERFLSEVDISDFDKTVARLWAALRYPPEKPEGALGEA